MCGLGGGAPAVRWKPRRVLRVLEFRLADGHDAWRRSRASSFDPAESPDVLIYRIIPLVGRRGRFELARVADPGGAMIRASRRVYNKEFRAAAALLQAIRINCASRTG
jgi:hypothetical protein